MATKPPNLVLIESLFNLERLANASVDDSDSVLRAAFDEFIGDLAKLDPTAVQLRYRRDRIARLLDRAKAILGDAYDEWARSQRSTLATIGTHEADRATLHLRAALGAGNEGLVSSTTGLSANYFKRIIDARPFQGATLKEWAAERERTTLFRLSAQVKLGVANGETLDQIIRRVRGRSAGRAGQYVGGVMQTTTTEAEAIVRTAVADVSSHARFGTYEANRDVVDGYELVVTMDGRTSPICINYGLTPGKVYDTATGPRPPFHWRCRTSTAPHVDWGGLGLEPPPQGTRATATGQKPADIGFDEWLRGAPEHYATDLLGPSRAKLFREGKMSLRDLLKSDGGRVRLKPLAEAA